MAPIEDNWRFFSYALLTNELTHLDEKDIWDGSTAFIQNIWDKYNKPSQNIISPLLENVLF
jgi:hypothetical protein